MGADAIGEQELLHEVEAAGTDENGGVLKIAHVLEQALGQKRQRPWRFYK